MAANSQSSAASPPDGSEILRIDAICDRHEQALRSGNRPNLVEALKGVPDASRTALLGELFLIEMQHREENRLPGAATLEALTGEHPNLTDELADAVRRVKDRIGIGLSQPVRTESFRPATLGRGRSSGSHTFHVTCPACHQACSVASDRDNPDVTCPACGSTFSLSKEMSRTDQAFSLKTVGHFELTSRLGMGGCGTVWKAYDSRLDRTVAIKFPRVGQLTDAEEERFLREAQTVARLKHPFIVPVHEFGRDGELVYFVSDYVRGVALSSWLTGKQMSIDEATELVIQVAEALHYAHSQGVIHRDVKPSNILLDADGQPHVTDFGLAKLVRPDLSPTNEGVLGTPAYMSPEQAAGEASRSDARTDVYGLGVVLFQLLTGELPFRGNREMLAHQIQFDDPPHPRMLNANISKDLETICLKCLEKPMAGRYDSAQALADDLRRFQRGEPIAARPVSPAVRIGRWCLRNRPAAAALAMLLFIAIAGPLSAIHQATLRNREARALADRNRYINELKNWRGKADANSAAAPANSIPFDMPLVTRGLADSAHQHTLTRLKILDSESSDGQERAYLLIAAGVLAGMRGAPDEAIRHIENARQTLAHLQAANPEEIRFAAAAAFCDSHLAQLLAARANHDSSPPAQARAAQATQAWDAVVGQQPENFAFHRALADAQVRLSLMQALAHNGPQALANVKRGTQTADAITARWPDDAKHLYLIACQLANCQPVLAPETEEQSPRLE